MITLYFIWVSDIASGCNNCSDRIWAVCNYLIYGYRRKDEKYLILLLFVLLRSTMESEHLNLIYSWFPVLLGMAVWGIREKTLET